MNCIKNMRKLLAMGMCMMLVFAMVGCGDTMNSATDGTKDEMMDPALDEMYDDGDTMMDDVRDGVDDVIKGTEDLLDDAGDTIMDGTDMGIMDEVENGNNYGDTNLDMAN